MRDQDKPKEVPDRKPENQARQIKIRKRIQQKVFGMVWFLCLIAYQPLWII